MDVHADGGQLGTDDSWARNWYVRPPEIGQTLAVFLWTMPWCLIVMPLNTVSVYLCMGIHYTCVLQRCNQIPSCCFLLLGALQGTGVGCGEREWLLRLFKRRNRNLLYQAHVGMEFLLLRTPKGMWLGVTRSIVYHHNHLVNRKTAIIIKIILRVGINRNKRIVCTYNK